MSQNFPSCWSKKERKITTACKNLLYHMVPSLGIPTIFKTFTWIRTCRYTNQLNWGVSRESIHFSAKIDWMDWIPFPRDLIVNWADWFSQRWLSRLTSNDWYDLNNTVYKRDNFEETYKQIIGINTKQKISKQPLTGGGCKRVGMLIFLTNADNRILYLYRGGAKNTLIWKVQGQKLPHGTKTLHTKFELDLSCKDGRKIEVLEIYAIGWANFFNFHSFSGQKVSSGWENSKYGLEIEMG